MTTALPFFLPYVVPLMTVAAHYSSRNWHALIPPIFVWIFIPLCDLLTPHVHSTSPVSLSPSEKKCLESQLSFKLAVYLWCPAQLSMLVWAANRIQNAEIHSNVKVFGLLSSIAVIAAEGINCSHELLHRRSCLERALGKLLLVSVFYGHFCIEHARGHHFRVGTPEDPATMRLNESFYQFLPRTVFGGYRSAWRLEQLRLRRHNLATFSYHNEMILFLFAQAGFCYFFYSFIGLKGLLVFVYQSMFSIILLEQINAIEHYGLIRRKLKSGGYERVGAKHSWDAAPGMSNYLLFKLQTHSDHHLRKWNHFCFANYWMDEG